jgi:hypothetical protein
VRRSLRGLKALGAVTARSGEGKGRRGGVRLRGPLFVAARLGMEVVATVGKVPVRSLEEGR